MLILPPEIIEKIFKYLYISKLIILYENNLFNNEKILRDKFLKFNLNDLARLQKQIRNYKYTGIYIKNIHNSICINRKL